MNIFLEINDRQNYNYPTEFVKTIQLDPAIDLEPWWFIAYEDGDVNYWYQTLKNLYPKRELIPYAKFNANDDIACFDGNDHSGEPKIFVIHAYASEGWELHRTYESYSDWLDAALKTHKEWEEEE